ncbi:MAG: cell surface protein, partial [Streptococcaceae bacterium]|nr:cell surface protein [Streptococcaceae bacterium]
MLKKSKHLWMVGVILFSVLSGLIHPLIVNARTVGSVTVDQNFAQNTTVTGNGNSGQAYIAPITADGELVFCLDPWTPVIQGGGYVGTEATPQSLTRRLRYISVLWRRAGTDMITYAVAQDMIWNELGYTTGDWSPTVSSNFVSNDKRNEIKALINKAIDDYLLKPSFSGKSFDVILGKPLELIDTNNVGLSEFDRLRENSANIDYSIQGNKLIITAKKESNLNGKLGLTKSFSQGTPYIYTKGNSQTLLLGKISDPNFFSINLNIIKYGNIKIQKVDKQSGNIVPGTKFKLEFSDDTASKEVTTDNNGAVTLTDVALDGVEVTVTETFVPEPYVLDATPQKIKIIGGQTIQVTSQNMRQKGQVKLEKQGTESGKDLWNSHYSLAGNVFDIREKSVDGPIVDTITTDEKGYAESTNNPEQSNIEIKKDYWVTERTASDGFVNTFKPVKFNLDYAGQTVSIVIHDIDGTNQEITGESTLTKVDRDTGESVSQGASTFKGAEYTLFYNEDIDGHKKGDPVLTTGKFKPEITQGTLSDKPIAENALTITINENKQVGVNHLALGKFYWQETKSPIGYTLDQTKYTFEITKQDDSQAVITQDITAKQQVIRFNFNFFKYINSANGSASSGANGLEFALEPLETTQSDVNGEPTVTTAQHPTLAFDGYAEFNQILYGDYRLIETKGAPGVENIKPLLIHSTFNENKEDYEESTYTFTITEEGSEHPIKTVTIPYKELIDTSFTVPMGNMNLYDLPEGENEISSLQTWESGAKAVVPNGKQLAIDHVHYNLSQTGKWYLVSDSVDVEETKNALKKKETAEPVILASTKKIVENQTKQVTWEVNQELDTDKYQGKTIVRLNYLYESEEAYKNGEKPIALDADIQNQAQTITIQSDKTTVSTQAHTGDGKTQTFVYGEKITAYDTIKLSNTVIDGRNQTTYARLHAVLPNNMKDFK